MSLVLAAALALSPAEADLLRGIAWVESANTINAPDGDLDKPLCKRSRGQYQVTPRAVRELVRVGRFKPMRGYSLTNCQAIRKWLGKPVNNRRAATLYLRLMLERGDGIEDALCRYNGSRAPCVYADKVLAIARGE